MNTRAACSSCVTKSAQRVIVTHWSLMTSTTLPREGSRRTGPNKCITKLVLVVSAAYLLGSRCILLNPVFMLALGTNWRASAAAVDRRSSAAALAAGACAIAATARAAAAACSSCWGQVVCVGCVGTASMGCACRKRLLVEVLIRGSCRWG
jgi:hypothetical protein